MPVDPKQIGLKIIEADYYFTSIKYDGYFAALEIDIAKAGMDFQNISTKSLILR